MEKLISNNFIIKGGYNVISFYFAWNYFNYIAFVILNTYFNSKNRNTRLKTK